MKCKIFLFRHGQTRFNKDKRFTGWLNSNLTVNGKNDAKIVSELLKGKKIDVAFETKLSRSKDTLKQVLKHHNLLVLRDDRMMERCYGELQGHFHSEFIEKHGRVLFDKYHRSYSSPPPKGESIRMVERRVLPFIRDLLKFIKKYQVNVAISAHGNSMRPFRRYFEKASVKSMMKWEMPYDDYFEYSVDVGAKKPTKRPSKNDWKSVLLPNEVFLASDKNNVFKRYY
jgi:2,3-bisphosphoglycerate-dependent phosphoglycerate mutase